MIRAIVAIDEKRGMADEYGIPWDIPGDQKYYVDKIQTGRVVMGYRTYTEVSSAYGTQANFVVTDRTEPLREGFERLEDARHYLATTSEDVWNIGGPTLLETTLDLVDELYITQLTGDFHCTKFLPEFHALFHLVSESAPQYENGIIYRYQVWTK